jgi:hypothetical protein
MAIDPMLYQKLSGRSGDPHDAYGKALAQDAATRSNRATSVRQTRASQDSKCT